MAGEALDDDADLQYVGLDIVCGYEAEVGFVGERLRGHGSGLHARLAVVLAGGPAEWGMVADATAVPEGAGPITLSHRTPGSRLLFGFSCPILPWP